MKKLPLSLVAIAAVASSAQAADLPMKVIPGTVPASVADYNWGGVYLGANVGYGAGRVKTTDNSITTTGPLLGLGAGALGKATTFGGDNSDASLDGVLAGGQAGIQWQYARFVLGLETDLQYLGASKDGSFLGSVAGPTYNTHQAVDWFGTTRVRAGYALGRILPYLTAGVAYGGTKAGLSITGGTPARPVGPTYSANDDQMAVGWTAGAGVDYALTDNWIVRAEYLRVDLGARDYNFDFGAAGTAHTHASTAFDVVRVAASYKF